jgi:hypothetical protein
MSELWRPPDDGARRASGERGAAVGAGAPVGAHGALSAPDQMAWNHGLSRAVLRVYTRVLLDVYARGARECGVPGG